MNIVDCRGCSPLSYVKKEFWSEWIQFFERVKDRFWMYRDINKDGEEPPPDLVGKPPNTESLKNNGIMDSWGLRVDDISKIAMGKVDLESLLKKHQGGIKSGGGSSSSSSSSADDEKSVKVVKAEDEKRCSASSPQSSTAVPVSL